MCKQKKRAERTRRERPHCTVHSHCLCFSPSLFEDFENDVFVHHVALFLQESNEQATLKTHGSVPAPEKAIWTSNSCGPGQLNVSLIVITWCNDSQSKYSLQAITSCTRGTHYVLHYVRLTGSEQCSMKKFPPLLWLLREWWGIVQGSYTSQMPQTGTFEVRSPILM